jgi:hypothetical protein
MPALQQPFVEGGRSQIEISYLGDSGSGVDMGVARLRTDVTRKW